MTHPNRVRMSKLTLGLLAAFATAPVFAQATSAGIGGRVVGTDGAPVAGAEVTITHVESGTVSRATTDANGIAICCRNGSLALWRWWTLASSCHRKR